MKNLIDVNAYYVESRKAIDIAMAKDIQFRQKLDPKERLEIYTRYLKETKNPKEYQALKSLKDELEMKIKFHDTAEPVVPEDAEEKVRRNLEIEQQAAVDKTNELKTQLSDLIANFERDALPLIKAVGEMESLQVIPNQIDVILSHQLRDKQEMGIQARFNSLQLGIQERLARDTHKQLENSMSYLRSTTTPVKAKKSLLLNFLKGGK
ncbi:hypothetical protein [uncultured Trichococcus sp.]|uniref:hypothetical protein n=1 Tax=uncultured Trichococcus sp. TaxID=189665 RepID=UPI002A18C447|nr:hypothetical protein [uncultured Trichococcus sp.]